MIYLVIQSHLGVTGVVIIKILSLHASTWWKNFRRFWISKHPHRISFCKLSMHMAIRPEIVWSINRIKSVTFVTKYRHGLAHPVWKELCTQTHANDQKSPNRETNPASAHSPPQVCPQGRKYVRSSNSTSSCCRYPSMY